MKKEIKNYFGAIAGVVGMVFGGYSLIKVRALDKDFYTAADEISSNIKVDIPESIISKAVDIAVEKEANWIAAENRSIISQQVRTAVKKCEATISKDVKEKLVEELENINIAELKKEITTKTADKIANNVLNSAGNFLRFGNSSTTNNTAEIIKACSDAGMRSWEIRDVVNSIKE